MRKQQVVLKHVTQPALVGWHVDAAGAVEQCLAIDDDMTAVWPSDPGQRVDDAGLAGARAAEQPDDGCFGPKGDGKLEHAQALLDRNADHLDCLRLERDASATPPRSARRSTAAPRSR